MPISCTKKKSLADARLGDARRNLLDKVLTDMLKEEQKNVANPWASDLPENIVRQYAKLRLLSPHPRPYAGKTVTELEFEFRNKLSKSFTKKSELIDLVLLAGLPPGLLEKAVSRPADRKQEEERDDAIQALNRLCPGFIYVNEPILDVIIEKTVIAATSFDKVDVPNAKDWLRRVCIPKAPGTDRFQLSGRHFMLYPRLFAEVAYIRGVYDSAHDDLRMAPDAARAFVLKQLTELSNLDPEWLDLVLPTAQRGARAATLAVVVDQLVSLATGYVDDAYRRTSVSGFSERTVRRERRKWLPDWPQQSAAIKKAMLNAAAKFARKSFEVARS